MTVTCTIDRLYPQIQPANFTMRWGDTVREAVSEKNNDPDQSYRYGVQIIKTLTKEDNRMTVTCNVNPVRGTPMSEQRTLNVHCECIILLMKIKRYNSSYDYQKSKRTIELHSMRLPKT